MSPVILHSEGEIMGNGAYTSRIHLAVILKATKIRFLVEGA